MRDIPAAERDPQVLETRNVFETYATDLQGKKISIAISGVTTALAGAQAGGIPGAAIGFVVGTLTSFWRRKAYRQQVYAQMDAAGLLKRPRTARRGVLALRNEKYVFVRYPYAEQTALVIIPILEEHYPDLSEAEKTNIGQNAQKALILFRREYPDVPLSVAAEAVLAYYGIIRNASGVYDVFQRPTPGQGYEQPPTPAITRPAPMPEDELPPPLSPPPEEKKKTSPIYYVVIGILVLLILKE